MSLNQFDLQYLESRQLLAATCVLDAYGTLTITGTSAGDSIYVSIRIADSKAVVNDGSGTLKLFDYAKIKKFVVYGKEGNDSLWLSNNLGKIPAFIDGGIGDDHLYSPQGNDTLIGGLGNDSFDADYGNDLVDGGDGADTLSGGPGNDTLKGSVGNDGLFGMSDNDLLDGGTGSDNFNGGAGNDTVTYAGRTNPVTVDITEVIGELADDGEAGEKDFVRADIETVIGGNGNDKLTGTVTTLTTAGLTRNNRLVGGPGNDTLLGLDGNDSIDGGTGKDSLVGGTGTDTADYSGRSEALKLDLDGIADDGAVGENDMIVNDFENLNGGNGNDWIVGNGLNNVIHGNGGNDTLEGSSGNDTLYGDSGIDKVYGQSGDDTLYARKPTTSTAADNDVLDGGIGTDKAQVDSTDTKTGVESLMA